MTERINKDYALLTFSSIYMALKWTGYVEIDWILKSHLPRYDMHERETSVSVPLHIENGSIKEATTMTNTDWTTHLKQILKGVGREDLLHTLV